ncbi:MAG: WYL domain-containing protein [Patescibacteria group bacterium]|nr:WYL domain-containing protein [Patescibacteria group bacterium]
MTAKKAQKIVNEWKRKAHYMDFKDILAIIARSARQRKTVDIYYPKTDNSPEGWREVEPYCLANDIGGAAEHLVFGKDRLSPGHIFNGYTIGTADDHCDSFIVGKIKRARPTNKKFKPRFGWRVEF